MRPVSVGAVGAFTNCGRESARTELLAQSFNISAAADRGAKGMWPTKPLSLIQAAKQIAGPGGDATALLQSTLGVSRKIDDGVKGIWPTKVLELLKRADQIAG